MGGNHEKARASDGLLLSQQCETSVSFNNRRQTPLDFVFEDGSVASLSIVRENPTPPLDK